jgi:hypothetical protein
MDAADVSPDIADAMDHDRPPSALETSSIPPGYDELRLEPIAKHWVALAHDTWFRPEVPEGRVSGFQTAPPSVVTIAVATADGSDSPRALGPTATQTSADEQESDRNAPEPPSTEPVCQVAPESLLVRIAAPMAMHSVEVGQATDPTPSDPIGTDARSHEAPALFEVKTTAAYGPARFADTPTATHSNVLVQVTPRSVESADGSAWVDQDSPPSVVESAASDPTATQSSVLAQATASSSGAPLGMECDDHINPPSELVATTPDLFALAPTATHRVAVGHVTASKPPTPIDAPPGVGTAGAPTLDGLVDGTVVVGKAPGVDDDISESWALFERPLWLLSP